MIAATSLNTSRIHPPTGPPHRAAGGAVPAQVSVVRVAKQPVHPADLIGGTLTSCAATARQQRGERVKLLGALQFVGVASCEHERFLEQPIDGRSAVARGRPVGGR
jgi:hypothetical protein